MAIIGAAAIGVVGALASANATSDAAASQAEAAALQTLVARELHDHWKSYYRACDATMIAEVCATPIYVPEYELVAGRTRLEVLRNFGRARAQINKCQEVYCIGAFAQQCNFIAGIEAIALADATNFGYRREESEELQRNQLRLENIYRWLGLGRNLLSQSAAASQIASAAALRLGAQAGSAENGWMQFAGFLKSKEGQKLFSDVQQGVSRIFGNEPASLTGETGGLDPAEAYYQNQAIMASSQAGSGQAAGGGSNDSQIASDSYLASSANGTQYDPADYGSI